MRDVIRESGMSAGALYLYFKSKDELIEAIAESRHHRERLRISSALNQEKLSSGLHALVRSFANVLMDRDEEQERRLNVQLWAEALLDPKIYESVLSGVKVPAKLLKNRLEAAQEQGEVPDGLDCRAAARVLVALYQGLALQAAWEPNLSLKPQLKVIDQMLTALASTERG
jgi:AcrR family transcriptional regulator